MGDEAHKKQLKQLNSAIDEGLKQLANKKKVDANRAYQHLKQKIKSKNK